MSTWQRWLHHPESAWVRKCFFHIHLWTGAGVGLYIILMSISGSMIVYRNELERTFSFSIVSIEWLVNLHANLLSGDTAVAPPATFVKLVSTESDSLLDSAEDGIQPVYNS